MRTLIEQQYHCRFLQWAEATGEDWEVYSAIQHGRVIRADSLALLISALSERLRPTAPVVPPRPMMLAWAA